MKVITLGYLIAKIRCRRSGKTSLFNFLKECETHDAIIIPDNATNGDAIKAMFPESDGYEYAINKDLEIATMFVFKDRQGFYVSFDLSWWNALYKAESEE